MSTYDNEADNPEQREDRREGNILGATPGPYDDTEQAEKDSRFSPRPTTGVWLVSTAKTWYARRIRIRQMGMNIAFFLGRLILLFGITPDLS